MNLNQVRKIACSLPEVTEEPHFQMTSFRVRGKIFATAPPSGEFLHLFVDDTSREQALEMFPDYIEKLFWGKKVAGLRVLLRTANSATVKGLVINAWKHKAPKSLLE